MENGIFFSQNLKLLRKLKNLSQQELADLLGMKRNNIASYESAKAEPSMKNLTKMAHFFEVNLHDLITNDLRRPSDTPFTTVSSIQSINLPHPANETDPAPIQMIQNGLRLALRDQKLSNQESRLYLQVAVSLNQGLIELTEQTRKTSEEE